MHLFCENIIPNLVSLWSGTFKGIDTGNENYEIPRKVWELIGEETERAVKDILSSYTRILLNVIKDRSNYTAEAWGFWFIYLAPILLKNRFAHRKYYDHLCLLIKIMKATLKFKISMEEIDELEEQVIRWVQLFEECVSYHLLFRFLTTTLSGTITSIKRIAFQHAF
jgi:hypothetical protein